jgi:hypothetical protein
MMRVERWTRWVEMTALAGLAAACGGSNGDGGPVEPPTGGEFSLRAVAGGNNVPERYSSDLWVYGNHAYTGTWGHGTRNGNIGNLLYIWSLDAGGAPTRVGSVSVPDINTVSDVEVSSDGKVLLFSGEGGANGGIYLYDLADPVHPAFLDSALANGGVHTATFGEVGGKRYVFAARNPPDPALLIYDVTDPGDIALATSIPIPAFYGIHDTYVRDGLAFVFAWNTGVIIYDVGNGIAGGTPAAPVELSRLVTTDAGVKAGPSVHNGWWFHNPVTHEARYLFVGQEGPGVLGSGSSGDIHVVDVSDLRHPVEVAGFHLDGAGTHNFWMDEAHQILYAAYYNGGVVALDVSGTLEGDLSDRLLADIRPGGDGNTYVWGVQLAGASLYAVDMLSGLWQLGVTLP